MIRITKNGIKSDKYNINIPSNNELHSDECQIDEDVTLEDIFKIVDKNIDFWEFIIGNYCKEIINEGLLKKDKDYDTNIHYLELYWSAEEVCGKLEMPDFMSFHGVGSKETNLTSELTPGINTKSELDNYAIEMTPTYELVKCEVIVNETFNIIEFEDSEVKTLYSSFLSPTLFQIMYGIFWELSFFGSPQEKDNKAKELEEIVEGLKSGKLKTCTWEETFGCSMDEYIKRRKEEDKK